jgi:outer membrane protein
MSCKGKLLSVFFAVACALLIGQTAQAQMLPFDLENMDNAVGVGIGYLPDYVGSDDYMVGGAPFAKISLPKTDYYARLLVADLQVNLINHPVFRFGPAINYRFGRNDDVEDDVVKHMKEIDGTMEAGAFVGIQLVDKDNPRNRLMSQIEFLGDVGGEYDGWNISLSANYYFQVHKAVDLAIGAGLTYADDDYMKTYFGVDQEDSDRTDNVLPVYEPGDGFLMARVNAAAILHLSYQWHIAAGVQYRPLLSDASDSPVVDDRGDSNQWVSGIGVAYTW